MTPGTGGPTMTDSAFQSTVDVARAELGRTYDVLTGIAFAHRE